jgi:hypothetical protein
VSITKVVVILTRNVAKLTLQFSEFSTISREFTRSSKMDILLKMYFYAGTPRTFQSLSKLLLLCTKALRRIEILTQMPSRRQVG